MLNQDSSDFLCNHSLIGTVHSMAQFFLSKISLGYGKDNRFFIGSVSYFKMHGGWSEFKCISFVSSLGFLKGW